MKTGLAPLLAAVALATSPLVAGAAPTAPTAAGPMAQLKSYNEKLDKIVRKKSDDPVDKTAIKALVGELLDFHELAKRSLAAHWDTLSEAQRDEFVKAFNELIEKSYVKSVKSNLDYEVKYKSEKVSGDEATVSSVVKVKTKGKSTEAAIDYKLHKVGDRWMVFDVITDEVSMLQNYRQQFNKIITSEGYDALLKKIRRRTEEGAAAAAPTPPAK